MIGNFIITFIFWRHSSNSTCGSGGGGGGAGVGGGGGGGGCGGGGGRVDPLVTQYRTTVTATAGEVSVLTAGEKGAEVGQELGLVIPGSGLAREIIVSENKIYQV